VAAPIRGCAAQAIALTAAVTAHYHPPARTGGDLQHAAGRDGIAFSPWHPVTLTARP
jgi:hypothetical protein